MRWLSADTTITTGLALNLANGSDATCSKTVSDPASIPQWVFPFDGSMFQRLTVTDTDMAMETAMATVTREVRSIVAIVDRATGVIEIAIGTLELFATTVAVDRPKLWCLSIT